MLTCEIDPSFDYDEVTEELYAYVAWRDDELCLLCAKGASHVHHIIFRSQGGKHRANNLACLCEYCHNNLAHGPRATEIQRKLLKIVVKKERQFRSDLL